MLVAGLCVPGQDVGVFVELRGLGVVLAGWRYVPVGAVCWLALGCVGCVGVGLGGCGVSLWLLAVAVACSRACPVAFILVASLPLALPHPEAVSVCFVEPVISCVSCDLATSLWYHTAPLQAWQVTGVLRMKLICHRCFQCGTGLTVSTPPLRCAGRRMQSA